MTTLVLAKNATAGNNNTVISAKRGRLRGYDAAADAAQTTIAFHDCATTGAIAGDVIKLWILLFLVVLMLIPIFQRMEYYLNLDL